MLKLQENKKIAFIETAKKVYQDKWLQYWNWKCMEKKPQIIKIRGTLFSNSQR